MAGWKRVLFFTPGLLLILKNLLGPTTSLALSVIPSMSGLGWTYTNSLTSFWLWAFLGYVLIYFSYAFYLLHLWARNVHHRMKKRLAYTFILLDTLTIAIGVITDVILPLTVPVLPSLASIATAFFGLGYFGIIYRYDLFNIDLIISPDTILQTSNNPIFVIDEKTEILKCNDAAGCLLGYDAPLLLGYHLSRFFENPIDLKALSLKPKDSDVEAVILCPDQGVKNIYLSVAVAKDRHHDFLCYIISCKDVTRQKQAQAALAIQQTRYKKLAREYQRLAYYDPLTGLYNRRRFFDKLKGFESAYATTQFDFAVLFMDLDNFKAANDHYGHQFGDTLLTVGASKLQAHTRETDCLARIGGDEFCLLLPFRNTAALDHRISDIRAEFDKSFPMDGKAYVLGISIGYAIYSQAKDIPHLMQLADEAMYRDKARKLHHQSE